MIVLVIVRRCLCEICSGQFDLAAGEPPPEKCQLCGSEDWLYGPESRESVLIRQGRKKKDTALERPAAKSLKRQERGLRQYHQFKKRDGSPA